MGKKYELTNETCEWDGHILHRIRAVRNFSDVRAKQYGGWIEKEKNLSHEGDCWVADIAKVYGDAKVYGNALVCGDAKVRDNARVCGNANVCGNAWVYSDAWISNGSITKFGDYACLYNFWSSGRSITYNFTSDTWITGCFRGTTEELLIKAYKDDETKGKYFEALVEFIKKAKYIEQGEKQWNANTSSQVKSKE